MCNALGHPPGCTCGFGPDGGHGVRREVARKVVTAFHSVEAFINPYARCPVCKAPVFYYQSENGGKVYFDELGPPWPKHPCTSTSGGTKASSRAPSGTPQWKTDGWSPFVVHQHASIDPLIERIGTTIGTEIHFLYLKRILSQHERSPLDVGMACLIKPQGDGKFQIEFLSVVDGAIYSVDGYSEKWQADDDSRTPVSKRDFLTRREVSEAEKVAFQYAKDKNPKKYFKNIKKMKSIVRKLNAKEAKLKKDDKK